MRAPTSRSRSSTTSTRANSRRARLSLPYVAAVMLAMMAQAGCHRPAPKAAPRRAVTARLAALLPLHPAWQEVRQIDTLLAHAGNLSTQLSSPSGAPATVAATLTPVPLPAPLTVPMGVQPISPPSPDTITQPAQGRIAAEHAALRAGADAIVSRTRQALERDAESDVAARRAELMAKQVGQPPQTEPTDPRLLALQFQAIALQSQVDVLFQPRRAEARRELDAVQKQIAALQAQLQATVPKPEDRLTQEVATYRAQRQEQVDTQLAARRAALNKEIAQVVAGYEAAARQPIPAPPSITAGLPPIPPRAARSAAAVAVETPAQLAAALPPVGTGGIPPAAIAQSSRQLTDERARLVDYITRDVERRVETIATLNHWNISFVPSAGQSAAADVTDDLAAALKQQFRPAPQQP